MGHAANLILVAALSSTAAADDVDDFVPGRVTARITGQAGDRTSLALDGWYDVNARFRAGLTMSSDARYDLAPYRGLFLTGHGERFGGLAADAEIRIGPNVIGRAAIDTTRFAPTASAVELGLVFHAVHDRWSVLAAPVLRLGISRRDLANGDSLAALVRLGVRVWRTAGVFGEVRGAVDVEALRDTPELGAAGGVYVKLGAFTLTGTFGHSSGSWFGAIAVGWAS
ncbi:MAG: hypothetical protein ABI678_14115 [Kofleriaceae bacterium]